MTLDSRLKARTAARATIQCHTCRWLASLPPKVRAEWDAALRDVRWTATALAAEARADGGTMSDNAVMNHRRHA